MDTVGTCLSVGLHEIGAHAPLSARRVLLALFSYILFFTDIPRSGYGFKTIPYTSVSTNQYSLYGPYNYRVVKIERNTTSGMFSSVDGKDNPLPSVDLWLYKFDTTSVGMRSMMQYFAPDTWDPCLAYTKTCPMSNLDVATVFSMLDGLVNALAAASRPVLLRVESYFLDKMYDTMSPFMYREKRWQTIQGFIFENPINVSMCEAMTRPTMCQLPWSNYTHLGSPSTTVRFMSDYVQTRARAYILQPNQTLKLVVLESMVDNIATTGGMIDTGVRNFDIVTIFRIQTCGWDGSCMTTTLEDFRFEGAILNTNTLAWYRTLRLLRFTGQLYNVLRVLALLVGCYALLQHDSDFAVAPVSAKLVEVLKMGLRVPCQVVVYGSWLPVSLFVVAHTIDSIMVYQYSASKWTSILGTVSFTMFDIVTAGTCHMRNVWLLCVLSKLCLLVYPTRSFAMHGVPGVRGYAFFSASFLSIFLGMRVKAVRNTQLLQVLEIPQSSHLGLLKISAKIPCHLSPGGLWLDLKTLLMSGVFVLIILRIRFKNVLQVPTIVPHGALVYGSPLLFSTSWFGSLLDPVTIDSLNRVVDVQHLGQRRPVETILMNLAWMTDPILYVCVLLKDPMVHMFEHKATKEIFLHPLPLKWMAIWKNETAESFHLIGKHHLMDLPWTDRLCVE
ncbi:Aste57867_23583 [Aphanomyces stellatus]|uniref:Aste57867_23583 protein n=1 Tax=Aphanomyces stellatus TaxID=120398 RepID=A0A485LNG4_9STRA|nr:hypothetical protein As57867_023512 [Aphanomyces stellatus]VFU00228.1 Aste57867_23583 [Aphanomyces stellatus]